MREAELMQRLYDLAHAAGYSLDELRYKAAHGDEHAAQLLRELVSQAEAVKS